MPVGLKRSRSGSVPSAPKQQGPRHPLRSDRRKRWHSGLRRGPAPHARRPRRMLSPGRGTILSDPGAPSSLLHLRFCGSSGHWLTQGPTVITVQCHVAVKSMVSGAVTLDGPLTSLPRAPFPYTGEAPCSRFVRELSRAAARRASWASLVHSSARGRSRLRSLRRTRAADVKGRAGVKRLERRRARGESSACGRSSRRQFHRDSEAPRGLPVSLPSAFCRSGYTRRTDRAPPGALGCP